MRALSVAIVCTLAETRRLGHAVLILLIAATATPAGADPSRRQCLRTCAMETRACTGLARTAVAARRPACAASAAKPATCRRQAGAVRRAATASCRRLRKDCRACCRAGGTGPVCPVGQPIAFEPPPSVDVAAAGLPALPNGNFLVLAIPGAQLEFDPRRLDALTAAGACARWITTCVEAGPALDDCTRSSPPCATERPWEEAVTCCPATCFDRYQEARRKGADPLAAFDEVYFGGSTCFSGVQALLGAGR